MKSISEQQWIVVESRAATLQLDFKMAEREEVVASSVLDSVNSNVQNSETKSLDGKIMTFQTSNESLGNIFQLILIIEQRFYRWNG